MTNIARESTIEVPGVPVGLQSLAKEDIGILLNAVSTIADAQGIQFLLNKIRVTDCFEDDVNRLLNERSGLTGYVAARNNAHAIGKTLWIRSQQGDLSFAVIIDAKQIGSWGLKNPRCLTTVLHELIHVLYEERHFKRLGEEEYTADADTRERWLDGWASSLLDEFDVDRLVNVLGSVVIFTVIPAKAGIQRPLAANAYLPATGFWIPAFAGMTETDAWRPIFLN